MRRLVLKGRPHTGPGANTRACSAGRTRTRRLARAVPLTLAAALCAAPPVSAAAAPAERARPMSVTGTVVRSVSDDFRHGESRQGLLLERGPLNSLRLRLPKGVTAEPGDRVTATGTRSGGALTATKLRRDPRAGAAALAVPAVGTSRTTLVLLANPLGSKATLYSPSVVRDMYFGSYSAASWYREVSHDQTLLTGKLSADGDVYGWYPIAGSSVACDYTAWSNQARAAATAAGVDVNGYDHYVIFVPYTSQCSWAGLSSGNTNWVNGTTSVMVAAHEIGHSLGLRHASSYRCATSGKTVAVAPAASCTVDEYGDPFDTMGNHGARHFSASNLLRLSYAPAANNVNVTADGSFTLQPQHLVTSGVQSLRIPAAGGLYYFLEFRQPNGVFDNFAAADGPVNGVSIRRSGALDQRTPTQLIDTTPETSSFDDAPLAVGRFFYDPETRTEVKVTGVSALGATVSVRFNTDPSQQPAPTDTQPPSVGFLSPSSGSRLKGKSTSVRVAATDNVAVTRIELYVDGALKMTVPDGTLSYSLPVSALAAGQHTLEARGFDAAGNVSKTQVTVRK